jgi:hypothetical protein
MNIQKITQQENSQLENHHLPGKKSQFFLVACIFIAFSTSFLSCLNEDICEDVAALPLRIGFYRIDTAATTSPKMMVDSITVFGLGNDSIIYNNIYNVAQIEVPLNSKTDSCAFVIRLPDLSDAETSSYDTLWFIYQRQPNLISMDCGFVTFYELERINFTKNRIDSIHIEDSNIRNNLNEHIKVFPIIPDAITSIGK